MNEIFIYSWSLDDNKNSTNIKIWGLNRENETVCLCVDNFTPYVYIEIPNNINWKDKSYLNMLMSSIRRICWKNYQPINIELCYKKKLYYANMNKDTNTYERYPYLMLSFSSVVHSKNLFYKLKNCNNKLNVPKLGDIVVKMHEHTASPILQLTCIKDIPSAGWIKFKGSSIDNKFSYAKYEYNVSWKNIMKIESDTIPNPVVLSFDIEVNSTNINKFPTGDKADDKIFQISCVFNNNQNYLLTLGNCNPIKNTTILSYKNELSLLLGFVDLINEHNPNIILGYNILGFDIPYMIKRSKSEFCNCFDDFSKMGFIVNKKCNEKNIKWSSSAYRNQEFNFLNLDGRLIVDLLPLVRRDYKFNNYKLKTVSTFFLGETKDPLDHKGIFKCYRQGMLGGEKGKKAMYIVGKYCVQDSALVLKLYDKLQTWVGLYEMAKTCNVPIFYLYTQGQQIKVFSQVYKSCLHKNFVVENEGYIPNEDEEYTGATVFPPKPGLYEKVIPFDFASLYPTTIIAYNIDYSTLVTDNNIEDNKCNIIEWEDIKEDKTIKYKYRFLKEPKGVMPQLLEYLLDTRKQTKTQMKQLKQTLKNENTLSEEDKDNIRKKCIVLDKRQLAYKISANSMYGSMGVKKGYLPFLPGAMCTTARGRQSIEKAANIIQGYHNGKLIYGDTDSCYIHFPNLKTSEECWDYALKVEEDVSKIFPRPMKLEFEEAIYWKFFILSKKRYMAISCGRDGVLDKDIEKKGVLLARRDNSKFVRDLYENIITRIFDKETQNNICLFIIDYLNDLCSNKFNYKDFIITKLIGDKQDYKIKELPNDPKKRMKRLKDLDIFLHDESTYLSHNTYNCSICQEEYNNYKLRCLPAHIQLAEKMINRGSNVEVGSRLEYLVSIGTGHQSKQYDKLEDPKFQQEHSQYVKIDYLHYLKTSCPPIDQLLEVRFNMKDFMKKQYKMRFNKYKLTEEIKNIFSPKIKFI